MLRDFIYAAKTLRANSAFTATAVITLALGVGASTAIFSVANAVLLRPLPYKDPGRLIYACVDLLKRNVYDHFWSTPDFVDLRDRSPALEDVAAVRAGRLTLAHDDGAPEEVAFAEVSQNLFRLLGVRVVIGRDFVASDNMPQPPNADGTPLTPDQRWPYYAIVSHEYFERQLGGNTAALGQPLTRNGSFRPVLVGVLEPGVELLFRPDRNIEQKPDLWIAGRIDYNVPRLTLQWHLIGRLRPGATLQRAQAQADAVAEQSRATDPVIRGTGFSIRLEPMQPYLVSQVRPAILALMGAVIFLLLIACSNVANLFLVRALLRSRDLAVRTALGASWWRLARQMLAEALLVGLAGAVLGFGMAWAGIRDLLALAPANLPHADVIRMDLPVLAFSIGAGLAAAILFGMAPAFKAARPDVAEVLRAAGRNTGLSGGAALRNSVVVAEVALCFVLLVGSSLMFRSFLVLRRINPGYDPHNLLTFREMGGRPHGNAEANAAYVRQMRAALAAIPGVASVTAADILPLMGNFFPYRWGKEDALTDPSRFQAADMQTVLPGYFETMRVPLLAGRTFNESDNDPKLRRIVIDDMMAAKAFPNRNAVGQRILTRLRTPNPEWFEVIGVVAHQRLVSLTEPGREQAFLPDSYWDHRSVTEWVVRSEGDAARLAAPVRAAVAAFDRSALPTRVQTLDSIVERAQTGTRFSLVLITAFAAIASLLAGVGLYGVLSTVVRQRTAEIGVRMALGAAPTGVFGLMIGYGLRLSVIGIAIGLAASLVFTRAMTTMLIGIRPNDPVSFGGTAALFLLIALLATWIPSRRAAGLDPTTALRQE